MFALISGSAVVMAIFTLIIFAVIFSFLFWLVDYIEIKEPFNKGIKVVLVLGAVIIVVNALLSLIGHAFIAF